jgi:chemotaxis signal transduction protein
MNLDNANATNLSQQKMRALIPSSNSVEPLALMDCGEFSLLMSSKDIVTLMSAQKIIASSAAQTCGTVEYEQQIIPVFAFNKAFQLQPKLPFAQMTLVIFQHQSRLFAVCCSALEKIESADLHFYKVPPSMSSRKQPFAQFAVVNERAAGLSSAAELWRLLAMRNAVHVPAGLVLKTQELIQGAG